MGEEVRIMEKSIDGGGCRRREYATRKLSLGQPISHEGTRGQLRNLPKIAANTGMCVVQRRWRCSLRLGGLGGLRRLKIADVAVGYSG